MDGAYARENQVLCSARVSRCGDVGLSYPAKPSVSARRVSTTTRTTSGGGGGRLQDSIRGSRIPTIREIVLGLGTSDPFALLAFPGEEVS